MVKAAMCAGDQKEFKFKTILVWFSKVHFKLLRVVTAAEPGHEYLKLSRSPGGLTLYDLCLDYHEK